MSEKRFHSSSAFRSKRSLWIWPPACPRPCEPSFPMPGWLSTGSMWGNWLMMSYRVFGSRIGGRSWIGRTRRAKPPARRVKSTCPSNSLTETPRQLLARCRYALYKSEDKWTNNQWLRLYIAFERYPKLKRAYEHAQRLTHIYQGTEKAKAIEALKKWICEARKLRIKEIETCANTLQEHLPNIVNYFDHRSTNASAESFNAKIKQFRALQRGVRDSEFFLFRLTKFYA